MKCLILDKSAGEAKAGQNVELRVDRARLAKEKSLPDFNRV